MKIDVDGRKIGDSPHRVNPAGFTIHSAVHMARHDAACVIHTHTRAGMAVSAVKDGLLPISQIALQFYGRSGSTTTRASLSISTNASASFAIWAAIAA